MPNKKLALEWYNFAKRNIETAILLNRENHYTDVISIDIQQAIEKALKAIYAFNNEKIPKTHALDILFNYTSEYIDWKNLDLKTLLIINDYYQSDRYPGPKYFMPLREELKSSIQFAEIILEQVYNYIIKHE